MNGERTAWAAGLGLCSEAVEALTLISEAAAQVAPEIELDARDVWSTRALALRAADLDDLAERVCGLEAEHYGAPCCAVRSAS